MTKKNQKNVQAKNELETFEQGILVLARVNVELVDKAIKESEFSSQQEEQELVGYATFSKVKERTSEARQLNQTLKQAGIAFETRKLALQAILPTMPSKAKEKENKPEINFHSFISFMDALCSWHEEKYGKAVPRNWYGIDKEQKTGTQAVIYLLWQACQGDEKAKKLFHNQTDLNIEARKLSGKPDYNNPNSGKVFGHFLKWLEA